ncbi:hypothetical protein [Streptomyces sp. MP131-18]|nr:hypothetical protein [Streptomyces sp. MP131-18]ONK14323.1 hypothetical protein STBA_51070 [Streptomyces sp. MP131-18]
MDAREPQDNSEAVTQNVQIKNMLGRYSFQLPDLPGGLRPLRDKDAADDA